MTATPLLPPVLGVVPGSVTIVLFSQPDCQYCEEVRARYLLPMIASKPPRLVVAEARIDGARRVAGGRAGVVTEAELAQRYDVVFAPTVAFLGTRGEVLAPAIVGLSRDYFGAYLEARIAAALQAAARTPP